MGSFSFVLVAWLFEVATESSSVLLLVLLVLELELELLLVDEAPLLDVQLVSEVLTVGAPDITFAVAFVDMGGLFTRK